MHELSIAISIVDVAGEEAERLNLGRVLAVHLRLGVLSGVVKDALLSAWELAREQTDLSEARLVIEEISITVDCPTCEKETPAESIQEIRCAVCGAPARDVIRGRELEVRALEVDDGKARGTGAG